MRIWLIFFVLGSLTPCIHSNTAIRIENAIEISRSFQFQEILEFGCECLTVILTKVFPVVFVSALQHKDRTAHSRLSKVVVGLEYVLYCSISSTKR